MDGVILIAALLCVGAEQAQQTGQTVRFYIEPPGKLSAGGTTGKRSTGPQPLDHKLLPPEKPIYPLPQPGQVAGGSGVRTGTGGAVSGTQSQQQQSDSVGARWGIGYARATAATLPSDDELLDDAQLNDVYFVDDRQGWAVGDRGVIWHTEDAGRQWRLQHAALGYSLRSVFFIDEKTGWAAGGYTHPYTHTSSGVLLSTRDGGRTWQLHDKLLLPALRRIRFFDARRGWAIVARCDLFPGGLLFTVDGGLSWSPPGSGQGGDWTCGDMFSPGNGALAGRHGIVAWVRASTLELSAAEFCWFQTPRQLRFFGPTRGWLVGDGGLVRSTSDQGQTWQQPRRLPPSLAQFDLAAVTLRHNKIWMVGAPGTRVWHSPDGGQSWQWSPTGVRAPLRALCFVDDQHGWAVGALGTILATDDGGQTWRIQRAGASRVAVLTLVAQLEDVPLELIARLSADEGYLSAVEVLNRRDWQSSWDMAVAPEERLHEAVVALGGCHGALAWQFPVRGAELRLPAAQLLAKWARVHRACVEEVRQRATDTAGDDNRDALGGTLSAESENALRAFRAHLVRRIRMWRPEIIITNDASPQGDDPSRHLVNQAVLQAAAEAADRRCFPEHIDQASLEPWEVKKVYAALPPDERGGVELNTSQIAMRLGCSVAAAAAIPRGLLHSQSAQTPQRLGFRLLVNNLPTAEAGRDRDFTSGIELPPGGEARRKPPQPAVENLAAFQRLAQQHRNLQAIVQRVDSDARGGENLLGQIGEMTSRLDASAAAQVLHQLAERYHNTGRWDLAADCFSMLAQRYPDHPLAGPATVWLVQFYSSSEAGWRLRNPHRFGIRLTSATSGEPLGPLGKPGNLAEQALALGQRLENTRPELAAMPALVFPLAAAARHLGAHSHRGEPTAMWNTPGSPPTTGSSALGSIAKTDWLQRLAAFGSSGRADGDPWQQCRLGENWIATGRGKPPKPVIKCIKTSVKPRLDGSLDDAVWQASEAAALESPYGDDASWPASVALAYDEEFLYLAVKCRFAPGLKYPPASTPRIRDAKLAAYDRLELLLDVDRDYATYYRLSVDYRGFTADECWGDASWNPTWFVAAAQDEHTWCIEAAIPMAELVPSAPSNGDVWAVGIQRVVPGVGLQTFHQPATIPYAPQSCGYLVFQ